jgi:uncharacterized integral membrane protein
MELFFIIGIFSVFVKQNQETVDINLIFLWLKDFIVTLLQFYLAG